jgi:SAM-dependent methyltransferase
VEALNLLQFGPFSPPILDLGSGDGGFLRLLAAMSDEHPAGLVSADSDVTRLASSNQTTSLRVCCDVTSLPIRDSVFETVICNSVIEHVTHREAVLREAVRVANKTTGRILFVIPTQNKQDNLLYSDPTPSGQTYLEKFNSDYAHEWIETAESWTKFLTNSHPLVRLKALRLFESRSQSQIIDFIDNLEIRPGARIFGDRQQIELMYTYAAQLLSLCSGDVLNTRETPSSSVIVELSLDVPASDNV